LLDLGLTARMIDRRVVTRELVAVHRGVYRPAAAALTGHGRLLAAVLACGDGALGSHESAAWLWGLVEDEPLPTVSVFGSRRPSPSGVDVHRVKLAAAPSLRHGIPVVNPLRALLDLCVAAGAEDLVRAFDRGIAARLFTPEAVLAELDRWADVRRPGLRRLRTVVEGCGAVSIRSPSVLQNVFARLLARASLPPPVAELPVLRGRYRLDFAYPDVLLGFELDGCEHHGDWRAVERDHSRRRALARLGWTVFVYTAFDVWQRADQVVDEVRAELVSRGVRCAGTAAGGRRPPRRTPPPAPGTRAAARAPPSW
jgi:hypothetical protein